jgi:hypothetical protein
MGVWRCKQAGWLGGEMQTLCCHPPPPVPLLFYRRWYHFSPSVGLGFYIFVFQKRRNKWKFFIPARFWILAAMSNTIRVFWVVMPCGLVDMKLLERSGNSIFMV